MLLNLKQMVGRLIRSEEDRGLVAIVDARPDRPYFDRLGEALPAGCPVLLAERADLPALLAEVGIQGSAVGGAAAHGPSSSSASTSTSR